MASRRGGAGFAALCAVVLAGAVGVLGPGAATSATDTSTEATPGATAAETELAGGRPGVTRAMAGRIDMGSTHTCVVASLGAVRCWGTSSFGQLGIGAFVVVGDDELPSSVPPVDLGPVAIRAVAAGGGHTCALSDTGRVRCWGWNEDGQLGYGSTTNTIGGTGPLTTLPAVNLGANRIVRSLTAGSNHTCAVVAESVSLPAVVRCWGNGADGRLGLGNTLDVGDDETPNQVDAVAVGGTPLEVSAGVGHTCALLTGGEVRCWGWNGFGQLGFPGGPDIGDQPGEMPPPPVDLGPGRTAVAITTGNLHTCALLDNGEVRCWGYNVVGQLGIGSTANLGDQPGEMPPPPVDLGPGRTAVAIAAGEAHTCALLDDGSVRCWGGNFFGQLGIGSTATVGDQPGEMPPPPVPMGPGRTATAVAAGSSSTCAVLDDGAVRCWGRGSGGVLGTGSVGNVGDNESPASVPPADFGSTVVATTAPAGAPTAVADGGVVTVSWAQPTAVGLLPVSAATMTITASTGASQTVPVTAGSVAFTGLPVGVPLTFTATVTTADGSAMSGASGAVVVGASRFVPLAPFRLLDTRDGTGVAAPGRVAAGGEVLLAVLGTGGVPGAGVSAVVLNVTVTEAAGPGFVTAAPGGVALPLASNVNMERVGQTIPNLVTVAVGAGGVVRLFSSTSTHLIADVLGYYTETGAPVAGGRVVSVDPTRVLDTRASSPVVGGSALQLQIAGAGPVPATGASAVILNVTATEAQRPGYLTVYPTGTDLPLASNVNYVAGQTIPNQVMVPVGANGRVSIFALATTHVIVDVAGWVTDATAAPSLSGLFVPATPTRTLDTRNGPVPAPNGSVIAPVAGRGGAPATGIAAAVLNVTATEALGPGFVTTYPDGTSLPLASNLNLERVGQTIANHSIVRSGSGGNVAIYTQTGTHLVADLSGWFLA